MAISRYHIFSGLEENALWVEAADVFRNATKRMKKLAAAFPGRYFIYSAKTYGIVASIDTSHARGSHT